MSVSETNNFDKINRSDSHPERMKKRRYSKLKLLELRKSKRCQEWPKVLNKRFIGTDGKWDPVGAFENSPNFQHRTQSRDDIQHFYNERYRKRQRDDYKYYWYGETNKRYNSYANNHPHYYSTSKKRYDYDDEDQFDGSRGPRLSPVDYYPSYSYQMSNKLSRDKIESCESGPSGPPNSSDNKPEWFTGGPSNINETIELSGMSRELEAGILKSRKPSRRNEELFPKSSPELDTPEENFKKDDASQIDSHLMKIIKKNAKEKDKRKNASSAKEVEKVLKSILLRPNEENKETAILSQNSNGVVRTVNEIEANLKLKGNRGAGDMSAYYKLLGLVQNNFNLNQNDEKSALNSNNTETSTNNNHPRQFTNSKYPNNTSTIKCSRQLLKMTSTADEAELESCNKINDVELTSGLINDSNKPMDVDGNSSNSSTQHHDLSNKITANGYHNLTRDRINNLTSRNNVCNNLSGQFSNHMLGTGQNAYRWIRAMNNAASASARMTQMNQQEGTPPIDQESKSAEMETGSTSEFVVDNYLSTNIMENGSNINPNLSYRSNSLESSTMATSSYLNTYNNYMSSTNSLYNQMPMKPPFFPYNFAQNSMFGRQFLNPYLLQQLFLQKQWENRHISLQNQLRQFQTMIFNSSQNMSPTSTAPAYSSITSNSVGSTHTPIPTSSTSVPLPLNQGDCGSIITATTK